MDGKTEQWVLLDDSVISVQFYVVDFLALLSQELFKLCIQC